jgi:sugar phosphate isomerase/epimerase
MPASPIRDLSRCAVHTMTNKPWSLRQCVDAYAAAGIRGISVWRNVIEPIGAKEAGRMLRTAGLHVPALVRGGFFVAADDAGRKAAVDVNKACVEEAHEIGADMVVLVVGAVPGIPLVDARKQVAEGIAAVLPHARGAGVKLAIEPLHPMYAGDKSCVNRTADARRICEQIRDPFVGIALDVYHTWWDPDLKAEIAKAGEQGTLFGFHVCDWRVDTRHLLTDRGLMGDGCIDVKQIRGWVEDAGFRGYNEVEIFSEQYWATDQHAYLDRICNAYLANT